MLLFEPNTRMFKLYAKSLKLHSLYFVVGTYMYRTVEILPKQTQLLLFHFLMHVLTLSTLGLLISKGGPEGKGTMSCPVFLFLSMLPFLVEVVS